MRVRVRSRSGGEHMLRKRRLKYMYSAAVRTPLLHWHIHTRRVDPANRKEIPGTSSSPKCTQPRGLSF